MKVRFLIKIKVINLLNDEIMYFYLGKDGKIGTSQYYANAWVKEAYAKKKIEDLHYSLSFIECEKGKVYFYKNDEKMFSIIFSVKRF